MHLKLLTPTLLLLLFSGRAADLPDPVKFFGHKMGADRKLISYTKGVEYLQKLAEMSDRIRVDDLGASTLGNPLVMAVISTPENIKDAEKYVKISRKLLSGEIPEKEARKLAKEGKTIVLITCNIHSSEIVSSQSAPEIAYELVNGKLPLDDVIVLLMPSINPDGQLMIKDWYDKQAGTDYEGGRMPWLYHHYAGHDNNRDWTLFNLVESRIVSEVYYKSWLPQVILDHHQMGSTGARIWVPPYSDPPNPNVHPLVYRWLNVFGTHMALDLEREKRPGVSSQWIFTSWWPGTSIMTPWWHNRIGILTESASCRIASPIYVDPMEATQKEHTVIQPNPWKGGWWRMRDIVENQLTTTWSVIEVAAQYKEKLLLQSWQMARDQVQKGGDDAWILPKKQHDFSALKRLVEALDVADVKMLDAGDKIVIPLAQAAAGYINVLFNRQRYTATERPYDMAGWTLPLQLGVTAKKQKWIPTVDKMMPIHKAMPIVDSEVPSSRYAAVLPGQTVLSRIANHLFKKGSNVFWLEKEHDGLPAGSLIVEIEKGSKETLMRNNLWYGLKMMPVTGNPPVFKLKKPRIGLFKPWMASMDEGWTRLVLEQFEFEFKNIDNERMKKGKLEEEFDCILFPDIRPSVISKGRRNKDDKGPEHFPEPYQGGIGTEGEKALTAFLEKGGTILAFDDATEFAIDKFKLPVKNVIKDDKDFACPGSVLECRVESGHPITFGMPEKAHLYFVNSQAFQTRVPRRVDIRRANLVRYPDRNPLASGWIQEDKKIRGKSALVECRVGDGRVVLYGFRPQHRAQSWGTYKLVFNAIHLSAAERTTLK